MPITERFGGLWNDDSAKGGWVTFYERYDSASDVIAAVFRRDVDLFKAVAFEKCDGGPQWNLPWWEECRPEALFNNGDEAIEYAEKLITHRHRGRVQ